MNILSLFDGISCGQIALNRANIKINNYFASETNKNAIKVTQHHFPSTIQIGDVMLINPDKLPKIDLLIGGSPCTNLSVAGRREGMKTQDDIEIYSLEQYIRLKKDNVQFVGESYLFWEYIRLLKSLKPKYFLLENVRMPNKWKNIIDEQMGVNGVLINSNLVSAQNRSRFYWTNISFEMPKDQKVFLSSIILDDALPFTLTERRTEEAKRIRKTALKNGKDFSPRRMKELAPRHDGKSNCLTATFSNKEHLIKNKYDVGYRNLLPIEWERLQTLDDNYTDLGFSDNARYRLIGNAWTVDVVAHIFKGIN